MTTQVANVTHKKTQILENAKLAKLASLAYLFLGIINTIL